MTCGCYARGIPGAPRGSENGFGKRWGLRKEPLWLLQGIAALLQQKAGSPERFAVDYTFEETCEKNLEEQDSLRYSVFGLFFVFMSYHEDTDNGYYPDPSWTLASRSVASLFLLFQFKDFFKGMLSAYQ